MLVVSQIGESTHHLESVQFLLDLLGQERGELVAGGNLTTTIVLAAGPGVVKLELRAERDGLFGAVTGCGRSAIRRAESTAWQRKVLVNSHRVGAAVSRTRRLVGSTAGTRARGIMHGRDLDAGGIGWTDDGGVAAGFCRRPLVWEVWEWWCVAYS